MQIPDPIGIRRRNETNSDEHKQCLWTYYPWFVVRSEWCHSLWEVDWNHKIPSLTYKTSCKIQVGEWKTYEDPKGYQTRQHVAWSLDKSFQETRTLYCRMCGRKCSNMRCWPMWKITSKAVPTLVWNWKKKPLLFCDALSRMAAEGNRKRLQLQLMPVKNSQLQNIQNTQEKMKRQQMDDHIAETEHVESYHVRLVHKPVSFQEAMMMPEATAATAKWT